MPATPDPIKPGQPLLKPLADFYDAAGDPPPKVRLLEPDALPEPYRSLLVHDQDMTSTLQRFHDEAIRVQVLATRPDGDRYEREVLLVTRNTGKIAEFGAIEIAIGQFSAGAQAEILRAEMPLGAIMQSFRIEYQSSPRAFFEITSDALMNRALRLSGSQTLYGRSNEITNPSGTILAEIVEILPPLGGIKHDG